MDGYPAPASGSGQFSTNRWNPPPAGLYMAQRVGFSRITVLGFALSLMSLRSQQLVSAAKICWWSLSIDVAGRRQSALASTAAADQVPRCLPPADYVRALYTFDARDAVATRCVDTWFLSPSSLLKWRDQQVDGSGVLLDGRPVHSGIDLLNSCPCSLAFAVTVSLVR